MGGRTAGEISARLLAAGMDGNTPTVIMSAVTRSNETHWAGTLDTMAEAMTLIGVENPVLIGVGRVFSKAGRSTAMMSHPSQLMEIRRRG